VWDIGGRRGTVYELHGHRNKVSTVIHLPQKKLLLSAGEDTNLVVWDMGARRMEVLTKKRVFFHNIMKFLII